MRSAGSVGHGTLQRTPAGRGEDAVLVRLERHPVRARHREEHSRSVVLVRLDEERDRGVDEVELERPTRAEAVARLERVDGLLVEAQEVDRRVRARDARAVVAVEVAVHVEHELVDERTRERLALDRVELAVRDRERGCVLDGRLHRL